MLVSGGDDKTVRLWKSETGEPGPVLRGSVGRVLALALSPDGKTLASGDEDASVRIWDVESGKPKSTLVNRASKYNLLLTRRQHSDRRKFRRCDRPLGFQG